MGIEEIIFLLSRLFKRTKQERGFIKENKVFVGCVFQS